MHQGPETLARKTPEHLDRYYLIVQGQLRAALEARVELEEMPPAVV